MIHNSENPRKKKIFLILSLVGNLGLLGFFKYANFGIESVNYLSRLFNFEFGYKTLNIALPVGISFYTFQTLSYTLDIFKGKLKPTDSLLKFSLYVSFFPQLVAGPIVRAADFIPQLSSKVRLLTENFKVGLTFVGWGLVKKVVFADNIAVFVDAFFLDPTSYGTLPIWLGALAFGIQIYCDFSGYSDIAIGFAKILGFNLPKNFDKPYFVTNIRDFWKKWHISLSTWLQDYLYFPLGGNKKSKVRTYINLMTTMIIGGLWHGAAWNFIFWGFYHGILLSVHRFLKSVGIPNILGIFGRYKEYFALFITQYFVFLGWLIFRVSNKDHLISSMKSYVIIDFSQGLSTLFHLFQSYSTPLIFLALFLIIHLYTFFNRNFIEDISKKNLFYWSVYILIICLSLYFLSAPKSIQFIYFQF